MSCYASPKDFSFAPLDMSSIFAKPFLGNKLLNINNLREFFQPLAILTATRNVKYVLLQ
jgi:hypothetical protein